MDSIKSDWKQSAIFIHHTHIMVDIIDWFICSLGPDLDASAKDIAELGHHHLSYGIKSKHISHGESHHFHFWEGSPVQTRLTEELHLNFYLRR